MKKTLAAIAVHPLTYVLGLGLFGAVSVVVGVTVLFGFGWGLIAAGVCFFAAAAYITRGMTNNG